jgi:ssDNA-binding replication factor A large subunit
MYDFEALAGELLQSRPELNREELMKRIEQKKQTVGAGYLTDQGALFLVAGELGVSLRKVESSSDMSIKDLYIGTNDITVVARVLAVYPVATYNKKDGGTGKYRRLVLFDDHHSTKLTVWDEMAEEIIRLGVAVDVPVRIVNGYVKQGLDGKPNLNLGKRGRVEVVVDERVVAKLVPMSVVTEKLTPISQEKQFMAVECVVSSEPRYSEFVRSDGSPGSLFQFGVTGDGGKTETRVVIWSPSARPELKKGQKILLTNAKTRKSLNGEYELHGDAGSAVLSAQKAPPVELRVAAVGASSSGTVLLAVDKSGKVWAVEKEREAKEPAVGEAVTVAPDSESDGRLYCRSKNSVSVVDGSSLPGLDVLATKLRDVKDDASQVMVEVIALSHGSAEEVNLKDGTTVKKGELTIGDDTDEMKLVGWRELSTKVLGIQPGERLRVVGATPKISRVGTRVLQMSNLTVVERLRERD